MEDRAMRTPVMLLVVAMLAVSFDWWVTPPSADVALAQTGPVPTPAVNPRLGAPPPGGNLEGRAATRLGESAAGRVGTTGNALGDRAGSALDRTGSALDSGAGGTTADPALPGGRLGTVNEGRVGAPMTGTIPNPAAGAPAAGGAVPPPAAGAVGAQPGAAAPAR
jgi:hypothetical protein